jgi:hypothetical protein
VECEEAELRYPSDTGGWQLGDIDLEEYLDRYRDQQVVVNIRRWAVCLI